MCTDSTERWKAAPAEVYKTNNLSNYFSCNRKASSFHSLFYTDIQNFWTELNTIEHVTPKLIQAQSIWNNRYITIERQSYEWKIWKQNGILKINDILNSDGSIMDHIQLSSKYNINCNFLNALQLRHSIPLKWRETLLTNKLSEVKNGLTCIINHENKLIEKTQCKHIYWELLNKLRREPACVSKWVSEYPEFKECSTEIWEYIFQLPFKTLRETKMQSFQFKLLHRLTPCRKNLAKWKISDTEYCQFCPEVDNIQHFFVYCEKVKSFWKSFFKWWNRLELVELTSEHENDIEESIIFGFQSRGVRSLMY